VTLGSPLASPGVRGWSDAGRSAPAQGRASRGAVRALSAANELERGTVETHILDMAQSFADEFHLVEVTTDELVRGLPKKQLWAAAAKREQAILLVLAEVPEGWTAVLLETRLEPEEAALLKLRPGDVRELTR
jgi:hypothetical protein